MSVVKISDDRNPYFTSSFDEDLKLYEIVWHAASENMEEEEYKLLMLEDRDKVLTKYTQLNFILINLEERLDTMSPELQEWATENITVAVFKKYNIIKIAIVNSKDFATQFSLEQAIEEDGMSDEITRYFDNQENARTWLLET